MTASDDLARRAKWLEDRSWADFWSTVAESASILRELDPVKRRPWLAEVVREMYEEQGGLCSICSAHLAFDDLEVDHVIPFCYGGGNERANLQLAHMACNRRKRSAVDPRDLLRYLEGKHMNL